MKKLHIIAWAILFIIVFSLPSFATADIEDTLKLIAEHFGLDIMHSDTDDFNHDGITDIAAVLCTKDSSCINNEDIILSKTSEFLSIQSEGLPVEILFQGTKSTLLTTPCIWVATIEDGKFKVIFHTIGCVLGYNDFGMWGNSELNFSNGVIDYFTQGGSSWRWSSNHSFQWINGGFEETYTSDSWGHYENYNESSFNRRTLLASRSYYLAPTMIDEDEQNSEKYPTYSWKTNFYRFIPGTAKEITIDGQMEIDWWNAKEVQMKDQNSFLIFGSKNWNDPEDLSYSVRTIVIGENLYIFIHVVDDVVIFDQEPHLKQDHIEIWIDSSPSLTKDVPKELSEIYDTFSFMRHTQEGLYQFAIYDSKAVRYLPKTQDESIQYVIHEVDDGYIAEIEIPLSQYLQFSLSDYPIIGFTVVVSDTDSKNVPKQDTLFSTSTLIWGDPYTLGEIRLQTTLLE